MKKLMFVMIGAAFLAYCQEEYAAMAFCMLVAWVLEIL